MGYINNVKKTFKWKYVINLLVIATLLVVMIVLNSMGYLGKSDRSMLARIGFSMMLAVSLNLVVGFLGELSLGHAGFMCLGAYVGSFLAEYLYGAGMNNQLLVCVLAMLAGGLVAAVFGFLIGLPALRLKGDYLAIATLAFGEIVRNIIKNLPFFGGSKGFTVKLYSSDSLFIVTFVALLITLILCQNLIRSKHGRAITAIRDNEIAARAMGINVTFYKLLVFMVAAFFAGVAGVLYGQTVGIVRQETFSYNYSIEILVMVVLGGMGSINGSMIAAAIITYVNVVLQNQLSGSLAPVKLVVYALILIFMVLFNNAPVFRPIKEQLNFKRLFARLSNNKPETVRDDEAAWDRVPTKVNMDELLSVDFKQTDYGPDKEERGAK